MNNNNKSNRIAFCAMMAALGTVIMLLGGIIPVFTYCSPIIASLILLVVLAQYGVKYSIMVWAITGLLSMLIGIDKEAAFFYIFLGWYPIAKPYIDKIRNPAVRFILKLAIFSIAIFAMYGLIFFVLQMTEIIESFTGSRIINIIFLITLVLVMMLYDISINRIFSYIVKNILPLINKEKKKK